MHLSSYLPSFLQAHKHRINFDDPVLQQALVLVIAAPLIWNIVARTIRSDTRRQTQMGRIRGEDSALNFAAQAHRQACDERKRP